jgi:hypothetical protein
VDRQRQCVRVRSGTPRRMAIAWAEEERAHSTHRDQSVHAIVITGTTASTETVERLSALADGSSQVPLTRCAKSRTRPSTTTTASRRPSVSASTQIRPRGHSSQRDNPPRRVPHFRLELFAILVSQPSAARRDKTGESCTITSSGSRRSPMPCGRARSVHQTNVPWLLHRDSECL